MKDEWFTETCMCGITFQVYYDMYEKSKEKYAVEMQLYSSRTKPPNEDIPTWCYCICISPCILF